MKRRGVTGNETVVMFAALIITAAAFSLIALTSGIIIAEKTETIIPTTMDEVTPPVWEENSLSMSDDFVIDKYDTDDGNSTQLDFFELIDYIVDTTQKLDVFLGSIGE